MPACIYCAEEKEEAEFNRDHAIPESFGTFDDNFVPTLVPRDKRTHRRILRRGALLTSGT
jgi:hypothetical protein